MAWNVAYKASCEADKRAPRAELMDAATKRVALNGNDPTRFNNRVDDDEVVTLCRAILASSAITELDLTYNRVTDAGALSIAELLRRNATLQHINLSFNDIGPAGAKALADALMLNLTVVSFSIRGNPIGDAGGLEISKMLRGNNALVVLDLGQCELGNHSLNSLSLAMATQPTICSLKLDKPLLRGPQEVLSVVQHMGTMFQRNQTLVDLSLNHFNLNDDHIFSLLPQLVQSSSLKKLSLVGNKITSDGGKWIAALIARRPDFTTVQLNGNRLDDAGAIALASAIRSHPSLHTLDLRTNAIGTRGLVAIAEVLPFVPSLKSISLWGNRFEPEAAKAFHTVLTSRAAAAKQGAGRGGVDGATIAATLDIGTYVVDGVAMVSLKAS